MVEQREGRMGVLVIRAFTEEGRRRRLLVELLEVNPSGPDQVIGVVASPEAASRLVGEWLNALEADAAAASNGPQHPVQGDR